MARYHTDVWEVPAVTDQMERFEHPAVCPVEIPYRSIQAYTDRGASLFEPFGGSGTTLIAAEKASRRAYLMEINPPLLRRHREAMGNPYRREGSGGRLRRDLKWRGD